MYTSTVEILRLLQNMVRIGQVFAIDLQQTPARVRVQCGSLQTDWLPWTVARAGTFNGWLPPSVGETVVMLSPSGDPAGAIVIASLASQTHPAPEQSGDVMAWHAADGAVIRYDQKAHQLTADVPGTANVKAKTLNIKGTVNIDGPVTMTQTLAVTGNVTSKADVKAAGISLKGHTHGQVKAGPDKTGKPE